MKKIKTINKLLSSLTLLSPLSGIGFNSQYQSTQKVITEDFKNSLNSFASSNAETKMGDIYVNLDETGKIIQSYASGTGSLVIPDYVTQIANNAFSANQNITSLDLSQASSVTTIGSNAFSNCINLTGNLIIPSSVTNIWNGAFYYIGITSLDLSQATSLTTIGSYAFDNCLNLSGELFIPSSVTNIEDNAFDDAEFTSLNVDQSNTAYSSATNLGPNAKVLISGTDGLWKDDSVTVGGLALGDIVIPNSIISIAQEAFASTNITSLDLSQATNLTTIGFGAFDYCINLSGNLVIPSNVTFIGHCAFRFAGITSLDLSNATSLTTIGANSFSGSKLSGDLVIPSSVTSIGEWAFYETKITSLDLSQATSLTTIEGFVFYDCSNLTGDLIIPSTVTSIGYAAFNYSPIDNLYFLSETPPMFDLYWQPTVTGKVYVPSEAAKETYLAAPSFGFNQDQVEIIYL